MRRTLIKHERNSRPSGAQIGLSAKRYLNLSFARFPRLLRRRTSL